MQQLDMGNFLSMMMAKMEESSMAISNMTNRFNIIFRILFEKNLITKDDILNSLRKEYNLLKNLESVKDVPSDEELNSIVNTMVNWSDCNVDEIKAEHEAILQRIKEEEAKLHSRIDVADASVLQTLDNVNKGGGKIIL